MSVQHRIFPMPFPVLLSPRGSHRFPLTAYKLAGEEFCESEVSQETQLPSLADEMKNQESHPILLANKLTLEPLDMARAI